METGKTSCSRCGLPASPSHKRASREGRLLHATTSSDYFARYTSVGIVDAHPTACWNLIGDTCSWLTSIQGVQEVSNSRRRSGMFGEQATYDVVQTTKVNLVGKDFLVDMLLRIQSNSHTREMLFKSNKRNKLMSKLEGSFKVIPMGDTKKVRRALPYICQDDLDALLRCHGDRHGGRDKSIVVLEQGVQPSLMPPAFARRIFQKHLGRSIDHVMSDLQRGAAAKKQRGNVLSRLLPSIPTMPALPQHGYQALVPAFAAIGKFVTEMTA